MDQNVSTFPMEFVGLAMIKQMEKEQTEKKKIEVEIQIDGVDIKKIAIEYQDVPSHIMIWIFLPYQKEHHPRRIGWSTK